MSEFQEATPFFRNDEFGRWRGDAGGVVPFGRRRRPGMFLLGLEEPAPGVGQQPSQTTAGCERAYASYAW